MRVLLTNNTLAWRAGTELYIRDLSVELLRRGHRPVVYCTHIGEIAEELRQAAIPVITTLEALGEAPDVIHAQHNYEAVIAVTRFPETPAVSFCHGWFPWEERPLLFPQVQHYVAVSNLTRERLIAENGIAPERVSMVSNFFDARLFPPRPLLPAAPRRAVSINNQMGVAELAPIRAACRRAGIELDAIGLRAGRIERDMGKALLDYDLVFTRGRTAIEAMATGCAVILCDVGQNGEGKLGPLMNTRNFAALRCDNFALRALQDPLTEAGVEGAIGGYNAQDVAQLRTLVRGTCEVQNTAARIVEIYQDAIESARREPPPSRFECNAALVRYLEESGVHYKSSRLTARMREVEAQFETRRLRAELEAMRSSASWRWSQKMLNSRFVRLLAGPLIHRVAGRGSRENPERPKKTS